jgi:hypothetical protein
MLVQQVLRMQSGGAQATVHAQHQLRVTYLAKKPITNDALRHDQGLSSPAFSRFGKPIFQCMATPVRHGAVSAPHDAGIQSSAIQPLSL